MVRIHRSNRQSGWKKLNLFAVIGAQFLNFIAYLFSVWPYSRPGKLVPIDSASIGQAINTTTKVIADLDVVKANMQIYVIISVALLCMGFITAYILKHNTALKS